MVTLMEAKTRALKAHKKARSDGIQAAIYDRWLADTLLAAKDQDQAIAAVMFTRLAIALEVMADMRGWPAGRVMGVT